MCISLRNPPVKKRRKVSSQVLWLLIFRRLFPLFKPIEIIASFQNIAVMRNAIQQRGRHLGVAENLDPFPKIEIGGDNQRGFLIQMADQVKQQSPSGCGERQVTEFINNNGIHDG